ncbi:MAG TPA: hypothetical protein PLV68_03645, partial [Ilumatobacteraceae bacterium]|nr:hypothetical protein [Ilumatobacteraceae bacterium]
PVLSAYVNVVCHPDRDTARRLVTSILSVFARFAVMHGTVTGPADTATMRTLHDVANAYDMTTHSRVGSAQTEALSPEFIDRYAIAGP